MTVIVRRLELDWIELDWIELDWTGMERAEKSCLYPTEEIPKKKDKVKHHVYG